MQFEETIITVSHFVWFETGVHRGISRDTHRRSRSMDAFATSAGFRGEGRRRKVGGTLGKTKTISKSAESQSDVGGGGSTAFFGPHWTPPSCAHGRLVLLSEAPTKVD